MYEDFLRQVPLFAELRAEDLFRLCAMTREVRLPAGRVLFEEGDIADTAYILYEGELEILKNVDGRQILIDVQPASGTVIGEIALLETTARLATVRAGKDSVLLTLDNGQVHELFKVSSTAAETMLRTVMRRWRGMEALVRHNERMAQLGTLTAGIAHELNNPAAAVMRGARQLQALLDDATRERAALERLELGAGQQAQVAALARRVEEAAARPLPLDALTRGDREAEVEAWLEEQDIPEAWALADALVNLGLAPPHLAEIARAFTREQVATVLKWLGTSYRAHSLLGEIAQGAGRIAEIVRALKSYVYLDQAPMQDVDIHEGLDNTLVILRNKLKAGVTVRRAYAPDLPRVTAYGGELNQVWTNIVDNAADALNGRGEIVVRTRREGAEVVVEIEDDGPGIAAVDLPKIFDPFFTTKPPGKGTGLGLNISYNIVQKHQGQIAVTSEPGRTVFEVRLPLQRAHGE